MKIQSQPDHLGLPTGVSLAAVPSITEVNGAHGATQLSDIDSEQARY
jgi:hypothetical protein